MKVKLVSLVIAHKQLRIHCRALRNSQTTHSRLNFIVLISNQLYTDISIQMLHIHHPNHHYTEQMCVYKHPACPSVNEPL